MQSSVTRAWSVQRRRMTDLLHAGRFQRIAQRCDFVATVRAGIAGQPDFDQFMIKQGTLDFRRNRIGQAGRAGLHDGLEVMCLFFERAAAGAVQIQLHCSHVERSGAQV